MREIGKRDEGPLPHPQKLVQHQIGPADRLQGLRKNGVVKRLVRIFGQIAVRIALNHGQTARHTALDLLRIQFKPARIAREILLQNLHQLARPAANIQHARLRLYRFGNRGQIRA